MDKFKTFDCFNCRFLNKDRKRITETTQHYMYGCDARNSKYIVGWIKKDSELKLQGCSDSNTIMFGDNFVLNEKYNILYLGKVGNKRLLYNTDFNNYKLVKNDWCDNKKIKLLCRYGKDKMCRELRKKYYDSNRN